MNVTKAELIITAGNKKQFPEMTMPEVAFAGRNSKEISWITQFFFPCFLEPHSWHMEVPSLGVESEL